jgi:predicted ATP-binding protein involved in virulence
VNISTLNINNYRCFPELTVHLHPKLTVIVAPNGQGKTAVLDAIKVALWPFVAGFDLGSWTKDITGIHIDDVRRERVQAHEMDWRLPAEIKATGYLQVRQLVLDGSLDDPRPQPEGATLDVAVVFDENVPWQGVRGRDSVRKGTKTKDFVIVGALSLRATANALEQRIFSSDQKSPDDLPMLGYYGTGRLWAQKNLTAVHEDVDSESLSRTFAYRDCLDPASSYKHFAVWFSRIHQSYFQAQIRNLEKQLPLNADVPYGLIAPFKAVQQAVNAILKPHTGWHTLEYSAEHDELVLNHDQQGELKVSQLSDGIRNMLALVGDIAYRCYKLNAHLGEAAPRRTHGIVMVDEVDMHLHPSWQQTVLTDLTAAFPKLQFIVTTHSPQVLTSVDASCIRILCEETDPETGAHHTVAKPVSLQTRGVASSDLLAQIMGVDPTPDVPEARMLSAYHALIQQNLHENTDAQTLRAQLDTHFGAVHPTMLECDRMIRLQAFKQQLPLPRRDN